MFSTLYLHISDFLYSFKCIHVHHLHLTNVNKAITYLLTYLQTNLKWLKLSTHLWEGTTARRGSLEWTINGRRVKCLFVIVGGERFRMKSSVELVDEERAEADSNSEQT